MTTEKRASRKNRREHRAKVWSTMLRLARTNPQMSGDELTGLAAAELQEDGEKDGFDISILLQLLIALAPLIMQLFNRK